MICVCIQKLKQHLHTSEVVTCKDCLYDISKYINAPECKMIPFNFSTFAVQFNVIRKDVHDKAIPC